MKLPCVFHVLYVIFPVERYTENKITSSFQSGNHGHCLAVFWPNVLVLCVFPDSFQEHVIQYSRTPKSYHLGKKITMSENEYHSSVFNDTILIELRTYIGDFKKIEKM